MNFPDFYIAEIHAWIDCVDELSSEPTLIEMTKGHLLKEQGHELLEAFLDCSALVNFRRVEKGEQSTLMISTHR
jgi:hypothetical protein